MNYTTGSAAVEEAQDGVAPATRVFHIGLGAMGLTVARALAARADVEIVGARSHQVGESLRELLGQDVAGVVLGKLPDLAPLADVCVIATSSTLASIEADVTWALEQGMNVLSCAEELTFASAADPDIAVRIDAAARAAGMSVLGTGINPGFAMDVLPICLTAPCLEVRRITLRRINDLSPYGPAVLDAFGVGDTPEQFAAGVAEGRIAGHYGFPQSIALIARATGLRVDEVREELQPIVAEQPRQGRDRVVAPGRVAGCTHVAEGLVEGRVVIRMEHPQQVDPAAAGVATGDFVDIEGDPDIHMRIEPEIAGGVGTAALLANMVPRVVHARPGLLAMDEVGLPSVWARA